MSYIVKIPLPVGTEVTEHTRALACATLAVELGRPVGSVEYRGSTIADLDPLVVWHTYRETSR